MRPPFGKRWRAFCVALFCWLAMALAIWLLISAVAMAQKVMATR